MYSRALNSAASPLNGRAQVWLVGLVLLLTLTLPSFALNQNTGKLTGRVTDANTGEPLIGANVYLPGIQRGAATDVDGSYTMLGIPVGRHDVRVSYAGYETATITDVQINEGQTSPLDVQMSSSSALSEGVTVVYERPMIQRDAIGVPRIVSGSDQRGARSARPARNTPVARPAPNTQSAPPSRQTQSARPANNTLTELPVQGVTAVAAVQPGVVSNEAGDGLSVRGGRAGQIDYYVDGVRVDGAPVSQQTIAEQEAFLGVIPPQYGDVPSGAVDFPAGVSRSDWDRSQSLGRGQEAAPEVHESAVVRVWVPEVVHFFNQIRAPQQAAPAYDPSREQYAAYEESPFHTATSTPLSTFSIDVDRASYANVRRMLSSGYLPPPDAVRIEEFINAFDYGLAGPTESDPHPFLVTTEVAEAPWASGHRLVRVALQGRRIATESLPPANLVFLLDVSGSMSSPDKLPLVQQALTMLVEHLRPQDHVSIVVYAGASGLVLPPTSGANRNEILSALNRLGAGGSTAGAAGLELAYRTAREHFRADAANRVILATDGDFNVGPSSDAEMRRLVERERDSGVFLSVLGFGTGNLQDSKMEAMAQYGNGNYSYIDSIREAQRVLVGEMGGTLFALAKDVKLQVEFNPAEVAAYRLIGYDNRRLADEAFNDDTHDAGELGAGHTVTALYEIVPAGLDVPENTGIDPLRYQTPSQLSEVASSGELLTVRLRYKPATGAGTFSDTSVLLSTTATDTGRSIGQATEAMRWATAVVEAGLVLRQSQFAPDAQLNRALDTATGARGQDSNGDRAEFIRLMEVARRLASQAPKRGPEASNGTGQ